jgi:hypothetical protein
MNVYLIVRYTPYEGYELPHYASLLESKASEMLEHFRTEYPDDEWEIFELELGAG